MARMTNQKREDGRVKSKVYLGNGKYKYVYASNNKELEKKVNEVKAQLGKGLDISAQRDTFKAWSEKWLKVKKMEVSEKRYKAYKAHADALEDIHNKEISKIRTSDIQDIIIDKPELSQYTLTSIKNTAKQIFDYAIYNRVLDYNPALAVRIPQKPKECDRRALTKDEQSWLIDTPHEAQTAAMIMMYAGLRRGEMIPLLWSDIDLSNATINVNKSAKMKDNKLIVVHGEAKTECSIRTVYIPQKLVNYLKGIQRGNNMLVATTEEGKMHSETTWRTMWKHYLNELNLKYANFDEYINIHESDKKPFLIPNITPHWLRHTFITLMYLAGVDVMTAKEQAGHSDIRTTMAIYTHLDSIYKVKQISKLDEYISKIN